MTIADVKRAKVEALRFLEAAKPVLAWEKPLKTDDEYLVGSKETAAVRRASMDLTRALAKMRKP